MSSLKFPPQGTQVMLSPRHQHAMHAASSQLPCKLGADPRGGPGNKTPATYVAFRHGVRPEREYFGAVGQDRPSLLIENRFRQSRTLAQSLKLETLIPIFCCCQMGF
jgi:hypothetical protein